MRASCLAQSRDYSVFREGLYRCREYLSLLIDACYPEKEASVMGAMLLGEKAMLDEGIKSLYQQTAIIHILRSAVFISLFWEWVFTNCCGGCVSQIRLT